MLSLTSKRDQQLFQVQNILETLLEATQHFSTLIKKRELHQSIHAFTSIVEGAQAVFPALISLDEDFRRPTKQLEKSLTMIADYLEKGELGKIPEILQFSLHPSFVKLLDTFKTTFNDQKAEKTISIGVFHSKVNPKNVQPKERLDAMQAASDQQNTKLYYFTSKDVHFDTQQVEADTFISNQWERVTVPFPDVISNVGAGMSSQTERQLSRTVPFTNFYVGNKYSLPKRMVKHRKFTELLVPFRVCTDAQKIKDFMENNDRVVFKALGSNRGENIYFVNKKGSRYVLLDQIKERIMNNNDLQHFIENIILKEKNSYIIQKYIHTRTKSDEPYHFRAHVQKDGEGKWTLTHIYPRIGNKKSNLSNISTEGRVEDFPSFLRNELGEKQGVTYEKKILQLSIDVAIHLDKLYNFAISELGLDFAIDDTGRIWMHEANNGPQTAYHEEKRAINTIAYAKYIAENGIMYSNVQKQLGNTQFQVGNSQLSFASLEDSQSIGMMTGQNINTTFTEALQVAATKLEHNFFYFGPKDIDFDRELIKAYFFEDEKWVEKITTYPDVIIDYLKLRGNPDANYIYEELGDVPFTNRWPLHMKNRSDLYNVLNQGREDNVTLPAFKIIERPYDVIRFVNTYGNAILRQQKTNKYKSYSIQKEKNEIYTLFEEGQGNKTYTEHSLRNYIQHLMNKENLIIQQDFTAKSDIVSKTMMHLMLNGDGKWRWINRNDNTHSFSFLQQISPIVEHLHSVYKDTISEVSVTVILDEKQNIFIQDIDLNGTIPSKIKENETAITEATIDYAQSLI